MFAGPYIVGMADANGSSHQEYGEMVRNGPVCRRALAYGDIRRAEAGNTI
jgi:hypothetical protein